MENLHLQAGLLLRIPVVLFSLTLHEFLHALVALKCGDDTAYQKGRVTLNPLPHLSLIGTIALMIGPIGWAKPVPVDPSRFRRPRRDNVLVSVAGVTGNFGLAVLGAMAMRVMLLARFYPEALGSQIVWAMVGMLTFINFALFCFNLLPIPPLDGSHVLEELLPWRLRERYMEIRQYGVFLLLGLVLVSNGLADKGYPTLSWPPMMLTWLFGGSEALANWLHAADSVGI